MNSLLDYRTKPGRALPRVWRRFAFLRPGESFDFKGRTFNARHFSAVWLLGIPVARLWLDMERRAWIFPWTKVRTHTLVREAFTRTQGLAEAVILAPPGTKWPKDMGRTVLINNDDNRSGPSA